MIGKIILGLIPVQDYGPETRLPEFYVSQDQTSIPNFVKQ